MKKLKTVFFGTPDFSVPSLEILFNHPNIEILSVVSMPDRKKGRGMEVTSPEVIQFAKERKVPFFQTTNINKEEDFLKSIKDADLFVVLAFAQFLSQDVLDIPKLGCFNIHTSLLPKYRGAAPIQYAILNGDKQTGVSIQKMVKKMDAGDLTHSHEVSIADNETGGQLYTKLKYQAALTLNDFVHDLKDDNIKFSAQNEQDVCFAPTLKREDGLVDFVNTSAQDALNKIRALYPWPGTYCFAGKKRFKIIKAEPSNRKVAPGQTDTSSNQIHIGCSDKSIRLYEIQLEGKKACSDIELLNGLKDKLVLTPQKENQ